MAVIGENRFYLIDFHHLDPFQKDFTISGNHFGKKKITEEIKKCVPLCSNCHREFHYLERTKNTQIQDYLVLFFNVIEKKLL